MNQNNKNRIVVFLIILLGLGIIAWNADTSTDPNDLTMERIEQE